jgi:hypothetical protein
MGVRGGQLITGVGEGGLLVVVRGRRRASRDRLVSQSNMQPFTFDLLNPIAHITVVGPPSDARNRMVSDLLSFRGALDEATVFGPPGTDETFRKYLPTAARASPVRDEVLRGLMSERQRRIVNNDPPAIQTLVLNRLSHASAVFPPYEPAVPRDNALEDDESAPVGAYSLEGMRCLLNNARHYRLSVVQLEERIVDLLPNGRGSSDWIIWFPPDDDDLAEHVKVADTYLPCVDNLTDMARNTRNCGGALVYRMNMTEPVHYQYFPKRSVETTSAVTPPSSYCTIL